MTGNRRKTERNSSLKKYIVADKYAGMELEEYLKTVMQVSSRQRQRLFFSKGVYVNGTAAHTRRSLKAGDMVAIRQFKDSSYGVEAQDGPVDVLYEDDALIVLNKPAGMLVHPAGQTKNGTLANYLAGYFRAQGKVVTIRAIHRLDRDTTGCVLFAKNSSIQTRLEQMLKAGEIHRTYEAVICGSADELLKDYPRGTIDLPIARDPFRSNRRMISPTGQRAVTHFRLVQSGREYSLISLQLETGRTHQIRVHLSHAGYPVLGDRMYGRTSQLMKRQALHAVSLCFRHPASDMELDIKAPRPADWPSSFSGRKE